MARLRSPLTVTASPWPFSKKNDPIMPLDQNPHQTVTRFGCVGFSMYAWGFFVPQMRQFYFFAYPPRSKWASSEKVIFFFFAKIDVFCKSIAGPVSEEYTQQFFAKLFHGRCIYSQSFCQKSAERKSPKKYCSYFIFDDWPGIRTQAFASNKLTHYILDHDDFNINADEKNVFLFLIPLFSKFLSQV